MNRLLLAAAAILFASLACEAGMDAPATQSAQGNSPALAAPLNTRAAIATPTRAPTATATIGYEATADAAEATAAQAQAAADAANRLMVDATVVSIRATSDEADRQAGFVRLTARADEWTATAAPTAVPMTQAAQATVGARTDGLLAVSAGMLTATREAPTQMVAMANARVQAQAAPMLSAVDMGVRITFIVLALLLSPGIGLWLVVTGWRAFIGLRDWRPAEREPEAEPEPMPQPELRPLAPALAVNVMHEATTSYRRVLYANAPCTERQLLRVIYGVAAENKSLAVNVWEMSWENGGIGSAIHPLRAWLIQNGWAGRTRTNQVKLNRDGEALFDACYRGHCLPSGVRCAPEEPELRENMDMAHEYGGMGRPVGERL